MIITPIQVRFNDMDPMRRVNNSTYGSYLELARLDFCNKYLDIAHLNDIPFVLVRVEMDLRKSLRPMTEVVVHLWVSNIGNTSWEFSYRVLGKPKSPSRESREEIYVEAKSVQVFYNYREDRKEPIPDYFKNFLIQECTPPGNPSGQSPGQLPDQSGSPLSYQSTESK